MRIEDPPRFIGSDPIILEVLDTIRLVAATDATVLITGESGTGKELVARALHEGSSRKNRPFVPVNCGAVPDALLESELFGHVKGAFTGATSRQTGKFEAAERGTIFLDEIGEMSGTLQVKLLRVLQSGEYAPVGRAESLYCDVRVVAATNRDLRPLLTSGAFRQDLFYRLNVICLELPPLRKRRGDLPALLEHFLSRFRESYGKPSLRFSVECEPLLLEYSYPGNVRELENVVRRAVIMCQEHTILPQHLPRELLPGGGPVVVAMGGYHEARTRLLDAFERDFLIGALKECGGIVSRAAHRAGLSERIFHVKLRKHGLTGWCFRAPTRRPPAALGVMSFLAELGILIS